MNNKRNMVRLAHIYDYLQATALRSRLYENGIEAYITEQLHTSSIAGEPSVRLGGVSALSPGHPIYVDADQLVEAQRVLHEFSLEYGTHSYKDRQELEQEDSEALQKRYRQNFLYISILGTIFLPGFSAPIALYYLFKYFREGGKWLTPAIVSGILILTIVSAFWLYGIGVRINLFGPDFGIERVSV